MRFRFCGDLDCPDWVLAEMSTLSHLTSVKMKLLCLQVVKSLEGDAMDYGKIHQITADAKYDSSDVRRTVAALSFILSSAAKHQVVEDVLLSELQQLGLPKEHSTTLCRTYSERSASMLKHFHTKSLRLTSLSDVHWRVDYILSSSHIMEVKEPMIQMQITYKDQTVENSKLDTFIIPLQTLQTMLNGLKQAHGIMAGL